jgi:hypothetical protein
MVCHSIEKFTHFMQVLIFSQINVFFFFESKYMCVFGCEIGANSVVGRYCVANSGPFCWIMLGLSVLMIVVLRGFRFLRVWFGVSGFVYECLTKPYRASGFL